MGKGRKLFAISVHTDIGSSRAYGKQLAIWMQEGHATAGWHLDIA
jgi:hypothetical protein